MDPGLLPLLIAREWRHHPWRHVVALLAVALGVALAYSVHLINSSALAEFSSAVRTANGEPDISLRGGREGFDDALFERVAGDAAVQIASPILEIDTYARLAAAPAASAAQAGRRAPAPVQANDPLGLPLRVPVRILGIDTLRAAPLAPALLPRPAAGESRLVFLDPDAVFLNAAARTQTGVADGALLQLQSGPAYQALRVAGSSAAPGTALAVMDLAGAQQHFGAIGRLSRIDIRLVPGADRNALLARLALPPGVAPVAPRDDEQRVSNLSRAYRVNLTVLALVALFVGAFLVFSVVSLSVAQRTPGFALLGVLGLTARQRRVWVLSECALLGAAGSLVGLLLGAGMAAAALRFLAGDLGGGYFPGIAPPLQVNVLGTVAFGLLGTASALVGGWWPARQAEGISPALALKGLGAPGGSAPPAWPGLGLIALGAAAAFAPPVAGLPLAAYAAVAALLFGGVALVPAVVHGLLWAAPRVQGALPLLALQRARFQRRTASAAVAGVVASLALSVALTVMVASFRTGVSDWLGSVLPADLYARTAGSSGAAEQAWLPADFAARAAALPGVQRVQASRLRSVKMQPASIANPLANPPARPNSSDRQRESGTDDDKRAAGASRPAVTLIARPLQSAGQSPQDALPLLAAPLPAAPGEIGVFVSEAMVSLYGAKPGSWIGLPIGHAGAGTAGGASGSTGESTGGSTGESTGGVTGGVTGARTADGTGAGANPAVQARVRGVWRDYARQFGAVVIDQADYARITGDTRVNDLALWLAPGADAAAVQAGLRALLPDAAMLDFASSAELRRLSLRIFDRSFAVTYYLQAVAIAIGLIGIAASLSAQVLARRKEFGLLAHLGLTRGQVVAVVAGEGLAWVAAGTVVGLLLGLAVSMVLVFVVNPQSFHWTMDLVLPWGRLSLLAGAVLLAGTATAAFSARRAAGRAAVLSVKEDW